MDSLQTDTIEFDASRGGDGGDDDLGDILFDIVDVSNDGRAPQENGVDNLLTGLIFQGAQVADREDGEDRDDDGDGGLDIILWDVVG